MEKLKICLNISGCPYGIKIQKQLQWLMHLDDKSEKVNAKTRNICIRKCKIKKFLFFTHPSHKITHISQVKNV